MLEAAGLVPLLDVQGVVGAGEGLLPTVREDQLDIGQLRQELRGLAQLVGREVADEVGPEVLAFLGESVVNEELARLGVRGLGSEAQDLPADGDAFRRNHESYRGSLRLLGGES